MARRRTDATGSGPENDRDGAHEAMRARILEAALARVPFEGWTEDALEAGAEDAGFERVLARNAFPGGAIEAIVLHSRLADRHMMEAMEAADLAAMRTRERIAHGIRARLEEAAPHKEAIRRALRVLALPVHAGFGLACLYRTVDALWYAAGDTAVDFNFYTKRALLAGVYSATLLHWLDDASEGAEATWRFLDRRIEEAMQLPRIFGRFGSIFKGFPRKSGPGKGAAAGR